MVTSRLGMLFFVLGTYSLLQNVVNAISMDHDGGVVARKVQEGGTNLAFYNMNFGFFTDVGAPTTEDVEELLCSINLMLFDDITPAFGNECLLLQVRDATWTFDETAELPLNLQYYIDTFTSGPSANPPTQTVLVTYDDNFVSGTFIGDYVAPTNTYWFEVSSYNFAAGGATLTPGTIGFVDCPSNPPPPDCPTPAPTISISPTDSGATPRPTAAPVELPGLITENGYETLGGGVIPYTQGIEGPVPSYTFQLGYGDQLDPSSPNQREPTYDEFSSLMCQTLQYFRVILAEGYNDPAVQVDILDAGLTYDKNEDPVMNLTMGLSVELGDGTTPSIGEILQIVDANFVVSTYISDYVWQSEPAENNGFYDIGSVIYASTGGSVPPGFIPSVAEVCDTSAPSTSPAPTFSPLNAPTLPPVTAAPVITVAPRPTVENEIKDDDDDDDDDDDGFPWWIIVLILVILLCCCCCIVAYLLMKDKDKEEEEEPKEEEPEEEPEEEGAVPPAGDEGAMVVYDPKNEEGQMVVYDQNEQDDNEGQMVAYDGEDERPDPAGNYDANPNGDYAD